MTNPVRLDDLIEALKKTRSDALGQLSGAVILAGHLGDVADHLIGHAARNAEVRPEHRVLGLLSEPDALAARAVTAQGVTPKAVRRAATEAHIADTVAAALEVREE